MKEVVSFFILNINNFLFDERGRIIFNKIYASYFLNDTEYRIVKEFDINILLTKENTTDINILQVKISDFTLELNQNIYFGFINLINCLSDSLSKVIF